VNTNATLSTNPYHHWTPLVIALQGVSCQSQHFPALLGLSQGENVTAKIPV
jgi:hypothetical protein